MFIDKISDFCFNETHGAGDKSLVITADGGYCQISNIFITTINHDTANQMSAKIKVKTKDDVWHTICGFDGWPQGGDHMAASFPLPFDLHIGDGTNPVIKLEIGGSSTDYDICGSIVGSWEV